MHKGLIFLAASLSLTACQDAEETDVTPAPIAADFAQDFALRHRQQALLPTNTQPELTVEVQDISYTHCPKGLTCVAGTSSAPALTVTDAQGQAQQVPLPANQPPIYSPDWLDTTSVRANGRRYLVTYRKWELDDLKEREYAEKQHFTVWLRVDKIAK